MKTVNFLNNFMTNISKRVPNTQFQAALLAILISSVAWLSVSLLLSLAPLGSQTLCTNDGSSQYIPFLCEFWSIFHEGGNILYSFHGGLGTNLYLMIAYYLLSPFTFLVLFFDKTQIPALANIIIILKNILVIAIMAWYLASKSEKPKPILAAAISIAYGFSFYFLSYAHNFMWMDGIALVPLMLYGIERLNTRKGRTFYIISLALAILTNFYIGAIICIFLALYYLVIQIHFDKKGWENFLIFSLCSICAALIAGVVLIPVLRGLIGDNTSKMEPPSFEIYNNLQYFFSRWLPEADLVKISSNRGTVNLYMGIAPIFGLILFILTPSTTSKREKYGLLFLIGIYLISTQISFLNYAFHGFYMQRGVPNRYGFIINFLIALVSYQGISHLSKDSSKQIVLAGGICFCFFGIISLWNGSLNLTFMLSFIILLYAWLAFYKKSYFISLLITLESIYGLTILSPGPLHQAFIHMEEYLDAIELSDHQGRIEFVGRNVNRNAPMLYGSNGVASFNSIIKPGVIDLLENLGFTSRDVFYYFCRGWTPVSASFFGVQDIISNTSAPFPEAYAPINWVEDLTIYQFPYEISLGVIPINSQDKIQSGNKFENLNILYPNAFSLLEVNATLSKENKEVGNDTYNKKYQVKNIKDNDEISITLNSFKAENVYLYCHMKGNKSLKVLKNDELITSVDSTGFIVYVGSVNEKDKVTIEYISDENISSKIITLQAATLFPTKSLEVGKYYSTHCLQNQKIEGAMITGTYETPLAENMVFTIPYDKGWTAYINGEKVPISTWQNAFLSVPLQPGINEIKLTFFPLGLKEGMVVSLVGLLLAWILFQDKKLIKLKERGKREDVKN